MKLPRMLLITCLALAWSSTVLAAETNATGGPAFVPRYLCECLQYCCKPLPPLPCPGYCVSCIPYCRKPMPAICPRSSASEAPSMLAE